MGVKFGFPQRDEHRLRVFENRVLRKIFGSKREDVTGEWRRIHDEELYDQYPSPNIVRVIKSNRIFERDAGLGWNKTEIRTEFSK